jgi:hypothetical protein
MSRQQARTISNDSATPASWKASVSATATSHPVTEEKRGIAPIGRRPYMSERTALIPRSPPPIRSRIGENASPQATFHCWWTHASSRRRRHGWGADARPPCACRRGRTSLVNTQSRHAALSSAVFVARTLVTAPSRSSRVHATPIRPRRRLAKRSNLRLREGVAALSRLGCAGDSSSTAIAPVSPACDPAEVTGEETLKSGPTRTTAAVKRYIVRAATLSADEGFNLDRNFAAKSAHSRVRLGAAPDLELRRSLTRARAFTPHLAS